MPRILIVATTFALSLVACTSATKRYEQGAELQREGRPADAAERFIQALKKDGRLDSARAGLRSAGAAAIGEDLRIASGPGSAADPAGSADGAADAFLAIDDLRRRSLEVGVDLAVPADYTDKRRAALDRAINEDLAESRRLATREQFDAALSRLSRVSNYYQPGPVQRDWLDAGRGDVLLGWARADMAQGRFRSAYDRADGIVAAVGANKPAADEARSIQATALARGTRRVAIIPVWATISARSRMPDDALPALGDALLENPWQNPPRFVALVPPGQVERELRRLDLSRRTLSTGEATRLNRDLGADYVVVAEIDSVQRDQVGVKVTRRPVRTSKGIDTAYVVEEGNARLYARATYVIIDRDGQRWTDHQSVAAMATAPFTHARYAGGDYRTLDLRQAERDLFDRGQDDRADRELVRSLVSSMSPRLADAVFGEVLRRVP